MEKIKGQSVSNGIAISKIKVLERDDLVIEEKGKGYEIEKEIVQKAIKKSKAQLEKLKEKAPLDEAGIFDAHIFLLEDMEAINTMDGYLNQGFSASYSVFRAKNDLKGIFLNMEDEYFRARANDIEDVMMRVLNNINGKDLETIEGDYILVSDELYPSETLEMDFKKIKGIATLRGSKTSHTTILANNFKIPALISLESSDITALDGKSAIIDANIGELIVDPTKELLEEYKIKKETLEKRESELKAYIDKEAITKSGKKISIYANIGSEIEAEEALKNGAEGVGLFRSEFLFLGRDKAPDEEEQFRAYKSSLSFMNKRPVIIRTLDIGADKQVLYLDLKKEENPQMGVRGIRISLKDKELFKTQIRALLRASVYGDLRVMLPMVISEVEVLKTREIIEECKKELEEKNIPYQDFKLGVMIETPAAAITADEIGKYVDFFSIGTNDLVSYCLAIDRQNNELSDYRDDHHLAIKRLLKMIAEAAKKNEIEVGICGAMGADLTMLDYYLEIGIDELSVSLSKILTMKEAVINKE